MDCARDMVAMTRSMKRMQAALSVLDERTKKCKAILIDAMENGTFPDNARIDGATVFIRNQVWASPDGGNHARLTEVLDDLGMVEYLPKTVNSQSISAYVREHLDPDETLPLDERLESLDPALRAVLKITEKSDIRVTGA